MTKIKLFEHQKKALECTKKFKSCAYYLDMGLGKTFVSTEKMKQLDKDLNIIICQKSKIKDWEEHIKTYYPEYFILNIKDPAAAAAAGKKRVLVINYDLFWRRKEIFKLKNFTLILDESSYIKNPKSTRSKGILKLKYENIILLSGTPISGKYEELYFQLKLLGSTLSKESFYKNYIITRSIKISGFSKDIIVGYKNIDHLKRKSRELGCYFMKTDEVFELPDKIEKEIFIDPEKNYKKFEKDKYIKLKDGTELIGDNTLSLMLYLRQLCGIYSENKLNYLKAMLESTEDRIIIFYNFKLEYEQIKKICQDLNKPLSSVNGSINDLKAYESDNNSVTLIQYQAGSMGLNLQLCNQIIYYTLPLRSELFEQSKKRIHRIGQNRTCFYYYLIIEKSIESKIMKVLKERKDFTDFLFKE